MKLSWHVENEIELLVLGKSGTMVLGLLVFGLI